MTISQRQYPESQKSNLGVFKIYSLGAEPLTINGRVTLVTHKMCQAFVPKCASFYVSDLTNAH